MRLACLVGSLVVFAIACGNKTAREETKSPPPPPPADASAVAVEIDAGVVDASVADAAAIVVDVPTKAAALQPWLVAAHYKAWPRESKTHESDGPHGDAVKTFISPSLAASLGANAPAHPKGAAAVKELYDKTGKHTGWAVSVKVADDSAQGKGWYWYEVFSTAANAKAAYQGVGTKLCRECHTEGGSDQVLIPFPLQ